MENYEQLEEQMWDLIYRLLDEDETRELCQRISAEPEVARMYSRVRLQADKVGAAARRSDLEVELCLPEERQEPTPEVAPEPIARNLLTAAEAMVVVAAGILIVVAASWLFGPTSPLDDQPYQQQVASIVEAHSHVVVAAPQVVPPGETSVPIEVQVASPSGAPKEALVEYRILNEAGEEQRVDQFRTGRSGKHKLSVALDPSSEQTTFEVQSVDGETAQVRSTIVAGRRDYITERPDREFGQHTLSDNRRSLERDGASVSKLSSDQGVRKRVQVDLARRESDLLARSPNEESDAAKVEDRSVQPYFQFFPEGGSLTADVRNKVFLSVTDEESNPLELEGSVQMTGGQSAKFVAGTMGRGVVELQPGSSDQFSVRWTSRDGRQSGEVSVKIPVAGAIAIDATKGVVDAGKKLQFELKSPESELPVSLTALCRNQIVGFETLELQEKHDMEMELPADVSGVIRLIAFDCRFRPPKPAAERLFYRIPPKQLTVSVHTESEVYSPGSKARLAIQTDDVEDVSPASVSSYLVPADAIERLPDEKTFATYLQLIDQFPNVPPQDLLACSADSPESRKRLEYLLGVGGWNRLESVAAMDAEEKLANVRQKQNVHRGDLPTPLVADNGSTMLAGFQARIEQFHAEYSLTVFWITRILLVGSIVLLMGITVSLVSAVPMRRRAMVPGVLTGLVCLVAGLVGMYAKTPELPIAQLNSFASMNRAEGASEVVVKRAAEFEDPQWSGVQDFESDPQRIDSERAPIVGETDRLAINGNSYSATERTLNEHAKKASLLGRLDAISERPESKDLLASRVDDAKSVDFVVAPIPIERNDYIRGRWGTVEAGDSGQVATFTVPRHEADYVAVSVVRVGGNVGIGSKRFRVRAPFVVKASSPDELLLGDRLSVPVQVVNQMQSPLKVSLSVDADGGLQLADQREREVTVPADTSVLHNFQVEASRARRGEFRLRAEAMKYAEALKVPVEIGYPGVPVVEQPNASSSKKELNYSVNQPIQESLELALRSVAKNANDDYLRSSKSSRFPEEDSKTELKRDIKERTLAADKRNAEPDFREVVDELAASKEKSEGWFEQGGSVDRFRKTADGDDKVITSREDFDDEVERKSLQRAAGVALESLIRDRYEVKGHRLKQSVPARNKATYRRWKSDSAEPRGVAKNTELLDADKEFSEDNVARPQKGYSGKVLKPAETQSRTQSHRESDAQKSGNVDDSQVIFSYKDSELTESSGSAVCVKESGSRYLQDLRVDREKVVVQLKQSLPKSKTLQLRYFDRMPAANEEVPLRVSSRIEMREVKLHDATTIYVTIENAGAEDAPNVIAEIGVPAGLAISTSGLQARVNETGIAEYSQQGNVLLVRWDSIDGKKKVKVAVDVVAKHVGQFTSPACSVYRKEQPAERNWSKDWRVNIVP